MSKVANSKDSYLRPRWLINHYQPLVADPHLGGDTEVGSQTQNFAPVATAINGCDIYAESESDLNQ